MARVRLAGVMAVLALAVAAPAAAAGPLVHAHRGGTLAEGHPVTPENSMTAFRNAVAAGADVVELDAKLTKDGVPVVMHDSTLDRTTDCRGELRARTAARLAACHVDILGTSGHSVHVPGATEPVPTLAEVLAWARDEGVRLNIEIKNQPTDPDFDPTPSSARTIVTAIARSRIPKRLVLVQGFWPFDLDVAQAGGFRTSLLTIAAMNELLLPYGALRHHWLSPQWAPLHAGLYVQVAHAFGKRVVPWTLNGASAIRAARSAGVDALITDDPPLALRALGRGT